MALARGAAKFMTKQKWIFPARRISVAVMAEPRGGG